MAVATSEGCVCVYKLDIADGASLIKESTVQLFDPAILVLSLAWYARLNSPLTHYPSVIAVSASDGQVVVFDYNRQQSNGHAQKLTMSQAHSLEAWTVAWSNEYREAEGGLADLYSGGDDSTLCRLSPSGLPLGTEEGTGDEAQILHEPSHRDKKTHDAGVTAILPMFLSDPDEVEFLLTGSYDEYIRVIALPDSGGRTKVLAERHLGGGVWRLKLVAKFATAKQGVHLLVLASCMHAGAKFLKIQSSEDQTSWSIDVIANFEEHESMNYASDGRIESLEGEHRSRYTFVSTSFYDRKLCVWHVEHLDESANEI